GRARAQMKNRLDARVVVMTGQERLEKVRAVLLVGVAQGDEVLPACVGAQGDEKDEVVVAELVQAPGERAADEAGGAGDDVAGGGGGHGGKIRRRPSARAGVGREQWAVDRGQW